MGSGRVSLRIETGDGDGWTVYDVRCPRCARFLALDTLRDYVTYEPQKLTHEDIKNGHGWGSIFPILSLFATCARDGNVVAQWSAA